MRHMQSAPPGQSSALRLTGTCLPCVLLCVSCMHAFHSLLPHDEVGVATLSESKSLDRA